MMMRSTMIALAMTTVAAFPVPGTWSAEGANITYEGDIEAEDGTEHSRRRLSTTYDAGQVRIHDGTRGINPGPLRDFNVYCCDEVRWTGGRVTCKEPGKCPIPVPGENSKDATSRRNNGHFWTEELFWKVGTGNAPDNQLGCVYVKAVGGGSFDGLDCEHVGFDCEAKECPVGEYAANCGNGGYKDCLKCRECPDGQQLVGCEGAEAGECVANPPSSPPPPPPGYTRLQLFTMDVLHALDPEAADVATPNSCTGDCVEEFADFDRHFRASKLGLALRLRAALERGNADPPLPFDFERVQGSTFEAKLIESLKQNVRTLLMELETSSEPGQGGGRRVSMWSAEYLHEKMHKFLERSQLADAHDTWRDSELVLVDAKLASGWAEHFTNQGNAYGVAIDQGLEQLKTAFEDIRTISNKMTELQSEKEKQKDELEEAIEKANRKARRMQAFNLAVSVLGAVFTGGRTIFNDWRSSLEFYKTAANLATDKTLLESIEKIAIATIEFKDLRSKEQRAKDLSFEFELDPLNTESDIEKMFKPAEESTADSEADNEALMNALRDVQNIEVGQLGAWWDTMADEVITKELAPLDLPEARDYAVTIGSLAAYGKQLTEKQTEVLAIAAQMQKEAAMRGAFLESRKTMAALAGDLEGEVQLKQAAIAHLLVSSALSANSMLRDLCTNVAYQMGSGAYRFSSDVQKTCGKEIGTTINLPSIDDYVALTSGGMSPFQFLERYRDAVSHIGSALDAIRPRLTIGAAEQIDIELTEDQMEALYDTGEVAFRLTPEDFNRQAGTDRHFDQPKIVGWYPYMTSIYKDEPSDDVQFNWIDYTLSLGSKHTLYSAKDPEGVAFTMPPFPSWRSSKGQVQTRPEDEEACVNYHREGHNCYSTASDAAVQLGATMALSTEQASATYLLPSMFTDYVLSLKTDVRPFTPESKLRVFLLFGSDVDPTQAAQARVASLPAAKAQEGLGKFPKTFAQLGA